MKSQTSKQIAGTDRSTARQTVDVVHLRSPEIRRKRATTRVHPAMQRSMTVAHAFGVAMQACATDLAVRARHAQHSDDPEAIHQLRVGIRQLRAILSTFQKALPVLRALGADLRALQTALGTAREWDVLVEETIAAVPAQTCSRDALRPLIEAAQDWRQRGHRDARDALHSRRCTKLLTELESLGLHEGGTAVLPTDAEEQSNTGSIVGFAGEALQRRHAKVRKLGKKIRTLDQRELHELRIRVKKLRYAAELFHTLWRHRRTQEYLSELAKLQRLLGKMHDATVAAGLVERLAHAGGSKIKHAGQLVCSWIAGTAKHDRKRLLKRWRAFTHLKPFWRGRKIR
jgi:CHAD domain-containing protein